MHKKLYNIRKYNGDYIEWVSMTTLNNYILVNNKRGKHIEVLNMFICFFVDNSIRAPPNTRKQI